MSRSLWAIFFLILISFFHLFGPPQDSIWTLLHQETSTALKVLYYLRIPRFLLAASVGGILGLSGAVLQGFLRNPLADPGVLGISSGASLGVILLLFTESALPTAVGGLFGAAFTCGLLLFITLKAPSHLFGTQPTLTLILSGIVISSLASAFISLFLSLANNPYATLEMIFWLFGSFSDRDYTSIFLAFPFMLIGTFLLFKLGPALNILALGEETAITLGLSHLRVRFFLILGIGLAVGAAVSISGMISFVGLVAPHFVRPFFGEKPSALLLPSLGCGAALTIFADFLSRLFSVGGDLKVGVVTALIGSPLFLFILFKKHWQSE